MANKLFKNPSLIIMASLFCALASLVSCAKPHPIPNEKAAFIGKWISLSGYQIEIKATGTARLIQIKDTAAPDYDKLNIKVAPLIIEEMIVAFRGDSILTVVDPFNFAKEFCINRNPFIEGDTTKMILNTVVLIKQK